MAKKPSTQGSPQPWQLINSGIGGNNPNTIVSAADTAEEARAFRRSPGDNVLYAPPAPGDSTAPPIPTDPKQFQQYLNDHGANPPLVVDGIIGPKTLAAAAKLNIDLPPELAPKPAPAPADTAPPPPPQPAPEPPTPAATVPAPLTADQIQSQVKAQFGYLGALLDHPDIANALTSAVQDGLTNEQALAALYATPTWRTTQASVRNWEMLTGADPASAQSQVDQKRTTIAAQAASLGISIAPDRLTQIATDSLRLGWDSQQTQNAIAAEFQYKPGGQGGGVGGTEATIKGLAQQYGVDDLLDDATLARYDQAVAAGTADAASFKQDFIRLAQSRYPGIAAQITDQKTTTDALSPYRNTAAQELGLAPDTIDFKQPKWNRAVNQIDPKTGVAIPMSLYDWQRTLRSDPTYGWDQTPNGKTAFYQMGNAVTQALGLRPGG